MSTFGDVINDVWTYLYGFGLERDKETSLQSATDTSSTAIQVLDGAQIDRGFIEIDDELMAVQSSDRNSGIITLHPWGRGIQGTQAANHNQGVRVVNNPIFPRTRIKAAINQIINDIYPQLYGVAVDSSNTFTPARTTYPVDADAQSIISIQSQTIGPSKMWQHSYRYQFDYLADTTAFPTGKSVDILESLAPGRPIKIVYRTRFNQFVQETDTFDSVNLDEGYRDILFLGATARLLPALDGPRIMLGKIEARSQAQYDQPGVATQIAKQQFLQYQQRLKDEQDRLIRQYPASMVRMS